MGKRFEGRVVVVTASTAGIGLGIVQRFAREGAKVILSSRKQRNVDETIDALRKQGLDVHGCVCHVSEKDHRRRLLEMAAGFKGKIDVLVSNAAINPVAASILDMPEWALDKLWDVNVKSTIMLVKELAPYFSSDASVVLLSSYEGFNPGGGGNILGMYGVTKTALLGLTKALARELGPKGVRVNCVAPGIIPTKLSTALVESEELREAILKATVLKRLGTVDEIAGVVAFLCSTDAGYITGENVVASGGVASRL
ncbi:hypothetical protein BSKO_10663 [Bryopsis sp. KO-2023]|nr:hypothetical protein BSKO_10663 [Bryopsis sp. KO-2023]